MKENIFLEEVQIVEIIPNKNMKVDLLKDLASKYGVDILVNTALATDGPDLEATILPC